MNVFMSNTNSDNKDNTIKQQDDKRLIRQHGKNEQLWFLENNDKNSQVVANNHSGYQTVWTANIYNSHKQTTSHKEAFKHMPLTKETKHIKIFLNSDSNRGRLDTKAIAEAIQKQHNDKYNQMFITKVVTKIFSSPKPKEPISSIYFSNTGNNNEIYQYLNVDNNIINSLRQLVQNNVSKYCFFSQIRNNYQTKMQTVTDISGRTGKKRVIMSKDGKELSSKDTKNHPDKYKEYYCVCKDKNGNIQQLLVPHDLVKHRVSLIELGKFDEALQTLQKGKKFIFEHNNIKYTLNPNNKVKNALYGQTKTFYINQDGEIKYTTKQSDNKQANTTLKNDKKANIEQPVMS